MRKNLVIAIVIVVVVAVIAFFGGTMYGTSKGNLANALKNLSTTDRTAVISQLMTSGAGGFGFRGAGAGGNGAARNGGGGASGQIIAKDDKSVTIQLRAGGSQIVFYSPATEISKTVSGTATDLSVGQTVTTTGSANSDGSLTATSIQLRPAFPSPSSAPQQ